MRRLRGASAAVLVGLGAEMSMMSLERTTRSGMVLVVDQAVVAVVEVGSAVAEDWTCQLSLVSLLEVVLRALEMGVSRHREPRRSVVVWDGGSWVAVVVVGCTRVETVVCQI